MRGKESKPKPKFGDKAHAELLEEGWVFEKGCYSISYSGVRMVLEPILRAEKPSVNPRYDEWELKMEMPKYGVYLVMFEDLRQAARMMMKCVRV